MPFAKTISTLRAEVFAKFRSRHEATREPLPDHPGPLSSPHPQRVETPSQAWAPSAITSAPVSPISPVSSRSFTIFSAPVFRTSPSSSTIALAPRSRTSAASSTNIPPPPPMASHFPSLPFSRAPMTPLFPSLPLAPTPLTLDDSLAAKLHDVEDALALSIGLNVTLILLLFPVLVPIYAVVVAAAGVHSALFGDEAGWKR